MNLRPEKLLVITTEPLPPSAVERINDQYQGHGIVHFSVTGDLQADLGKEANWQELPLSSLIELDELRKDFLGFIENWSNRSTILGKSFNELFQDADGNSLWWPAISQPRDPSQWFFLTVQAIWLVDRALKRICPDLIVLYTQDETLALILKSKLRAERRDFFWISGSSSPAPSPWKGHIAFLLRSMKSLLKTARRQARAALKHSRRSLKYWLLKKENPNVPVTRDGQGKIVMSTDYPRHVSFDSDETKVWYWEPLVRELSRLPDSPAARYWIQRLSPDNPQQRTMTTSDGAVQARVANTTVRSCFARIRRQYQRVIRYFLLERSSAFRESFDFCGADVSVLFVPLLRRAISEAVLWETQVDIIETSLRHEGNIQAALVHVEVYPPGMLFISACRRLGIPTIGVQHGVIYPMHMIYTMPQSLACSGFAPDYFAAYGQYAQEVLCEAGCYEPERVWNCGGPRFDHLVNSPLQQRECRERLGLPLDKKIVLITTQNQAWFVTAVRNIAEAMSGHKDVCLCVKCWNRDANEAAYRKMAEEFPQVDIRVFTDSIEELLAACDSLASAVSTTLLEANLLKKPTICLNYADQPEHYPFVEEGISLRVTDAKSARQVIDSILSFQSTPEWEQRRVAFLLRHMGPSTHGQSASTLARLIGERILASHSTASIQNRQQAA